MANRYWVGGTADWNATAGSKWAETSGGLGGETVPTSADDVYFDANSGVNTITIPSGSVGSCRNLTCTGFTGTLVNSSTNGVLAVHGSLTLDAGMTFTQSGFLRFAATTTGHTVTSAGKQLGNGGNPSRVSFGVSAGGGAQSGGGWTLQDAMYCHTGDPDFGGLGDPALQILGGTLDTNGYSVTVRGFRGIFQMSGSVTKQLDMGSSTFYLQSEFPGFRYWYVDSANTTINPGTSNVVISRILVGPSPNNNSIRMDGLALYDVTIEGGCSLAIEGNLTLLNTINTSAATNSLKASLTGNSRDQKLTVGAVGTFDYAQVQNITVVGATITGTLLSDLGGNQNITFGAPRNCYRISTGTVWSDTNAWSDSSGGPANADYIPLIQDIAIFDNNSAANTNVLGQNLSNIDSTARSGGVGFGAVGDAYFYGDFKQGAGGFSYGNETNCYFVGYKDSVIYKASGQASTKVTIIAKQPGVTVEITSGGLNCNGPRDLIISSGIFKTNGYPVDCGSFSSGNNVIPKEIYFGSSTVTTSYQGGFTLYNNPSLIFDAGTSTIDCGLSINVTVSLTLDGLTAYNASVRNGSIFNLGRGTVNNLTINGGGRTINVSGDFTVNGTLTLNGTSATNRALFNSNGVGTTRTISVATFGAGCADVDFRDIAITGAAAPISGTRFGNLQGNSGITFTSKTVYWNLAGSQNWNATGWAPSSGGSPAVDNFPLAQDTAVFDEAGSVGTVTINGAFHIGTVDMSARTSAMTLTTSTNSPLVYGNWLFGTGVTSSSTAGTINFVGRGTSTITSNGVTFGCPITINCLTGTVQLADALVLDAARTLTITTGTFNAVTYNVTTGLFNSNNGNIRNLKMGSGTWTLSGTGTVWETSNTANFVFEKQTSNILLSNTSTTARTFNGGSLSYNKLTIGGATGTSTTTINGGNQFTELASTKTVAHTISFGTNNTFGKWTVTGTSGNAVTLSGGTGHILAGSCTSGIDYLIMGSVAFAATSPGEFYAGANSTGTAGAPVYRTDKPADSTRYWVGGTGNWSDTNRWSTGSGGGGGASVPRSHDDVVFDSSSNATGYTATVDAVTGGIRMKALTIAGPATGNLTLAGSVAIFIHDDVTLPATGLTRTYTGAITLTSNGTGRTFVSNGVTLASAITVNGVDCEWTLGDALNIGSSTLTVTNGLIDFDTYNVTAGILTSDNSNKRTIDFGTGTATLSGNPTFGTTERNAINLVVVPGTSQINISAASPTFSGNGKTFYNVAFTSTSTGTVTINGANTFNNLSFTGITSAGLKNISISANQTINGTFTCSAGTNATMRHFVRSDTLGTTRTLTCNAVSLTDVDFRDITIAGSAAPAGGTRIGDCKGNSGITFTAATTRYWNLAGNNNWSATGWAASSGASPDINNFPLAQDTCVFESTSPGSGATITINVAYNIGTIDMSDRTSNTMTLATGTTTPAIYGNWINGTGTALTGTGAMTFAGRGSQTITSAGQTFTQAFTIDSPGGSVTLQDAFITNRSVAGAITLTQGTFDANGFNVTISGAAGTFSSSNSNTRTIGIGSGTWTIAGSGTTAWTTATSTNLTVTGTGVIKLTNASAKTFNGGGISYTDITLDQGGTGALTITGNNYFKNISNSAGAATTIALGGTIQVVKNWTASGASGQILTLTGSPAYLLYNGTSIVDVNFLNINNVIAAPVFQISNIWYAGANTINTSSLGWGLEDAPAPPPVLSAGQMFLLFM